MKRIYLIFITFLYFIIFYSCSTKDFELNKLSTADIAPKIYVPLAYGTFTINDYLSINLGADNAIVNIPEIELAPLAWRKGVFSFQSNAVDSVAMEVTVTNGSPMKTHFQFSFTDFDTGITQGNFFAGDVNPAGILPTVVKIVYPLTPQDLDIIRTTDGIKCIVTLQQPATPVTVKSVKDSQFQIQANFRSRVYLGKLK